MAAPGMIPVGLRAGWKFNGILGLVGKTERSSWTWSSRYQLSLSRQFGTENGNEERAAAGAEMRRGGLKDTVNFGTMYEKLH